MEAPPPIIEPTPASPSPTPPAMSLTARLLNVFAIPGDVFDGVKTAAPSVANWLAPALLLLLVGWLGAAFIYSQPAIQQQVREMNDQMMQKLVAKGVFTQEQADQSREMNRVSAKLVPYFEPVTAALITPFWWGFILWLVGTKILKGQFGFYKALEVAGLANAILVLERIVRCLLIVGMGNLFAAPGAVLLVKDFNPTKPSHSVLALANVMTIWVLAVRSIGLARLAGVPFMRAALWIFGLWLLCAGLLSSVLQAFQSAMGL